MYPTLSPKLLSEFIKNVFLSPSRRGLLHLFIDIPTVPEHQYMSGNIHPDKYKFSVPGLIYSLFDISNAPEKDDFEILLNMIRSEDHYGFIRLDRLTSTLLKIKEYDELEALLSRHLNGISVRVGEKAQPLYEHVDDLSQVQNVINGYEMLSYPLKNIDTVHTNDIEGLRGNDKVMFRQIDNVEKIGVPIFGECVYNVVFAKSDAIDPKFLDKRYGQTVLPKIVLWTDDNAHIEYGMMYHSPTVKIVASRVYAHIFPMTPKYIIKE